MNRGRVGLFESPAQVQARALALLCATAALAGAPSSRADDAAFSDDDALLCVVGRPGVGGVEGGGGVGPFPIAAMFDEAEPNDSILAAESFPAGMNERTVIDGAIGVAGDRDYFSFSLQQGDIVQFFVESLTESHSVSLEFYDASGDKSVTARTSVLASPVFIAPLAPFIPLAGNPDQAEWDSSLIWVVQETRDVVVAINSDPLFGSLSTGDYRLHISRTRSPIESAPPGTVLTVFLDFDGAMIDKNDIYNPAPGPDPLSPFADFIAAWDLELSDESALIDAILAEFTAHVEHLEAFNPNFDFEIRNSRDHADPFGDPFVTRLIIGGTREQLGVNVIGIAESIDVGDFAPNQTGFVLLDILSSQTSGSSINNLDLAPGFSKIEAVARGVAAVAAHELGHNIGGVHTNHLNNTRSVMDTTGVGRNLVGNGEDEILGTKDDQLVRFFIDEYVGSAPDSALEGLEPTHYVAAIAFSTPVGCAADLTGDGFVNGADLAALLANWGKSDHAADFNGDGFVNGADLAALLSVWGACE